MKGNQHYTEKQLERMLSEPAKDDGWGREPVRKPSKLESLQAQLDAEAKRAEYYAKRAREIEEAQFRLANEVDDLRTAVAKLTHERDEALASEKEIYRSYRVIADQREELKSRIAELEAERDRLRAERDNYKAEADAFFAHNKSVSKTIVEICGNPDGATVPAVEAVVADRDALRAVVREQVARFDHINKVGLLKSMLCLENIECALRAALEDK